MCNPWSSAARQPGRSLALTLMAALGLTLLGCGNDAILPDGGPEPDLASDRGPGRDTAAPDTDGGPGSDRPDLKADRGSDADPGEDVAPDAPDLPPPPTTTVGRQCTANTDCEDTQICLSEQNTLLPGGYCTSPCALDDPSSCEAGSVCSQVAGNTVCTQTCTRNAECRQGYACAESFMGASPAGGEKLCAPGRPEAVVGEPCGSYFDCRPGDGFCLLDQRDGYCSSLCDPASAGSCGEGAVCVAAPNPANPLGGVCAATCAENVDCRGGQGQACVSAFGGMPTTTPVCAPGTPGATVGAPCLDANDCSPGDGFCAGEVDSANPGGYCHTGCDPSAADSCGSDGECLHLSGGAGICVDRCADSGECRAGYQCTLGFVGIDTTGTVCAPGSSTAVPLGHECGDTSDCTAGSQLCNSEANHGPSLPGGYCSAPCSVDDAAFGCDAGATCVPEGGGGASCWASCATDNDCEDRRSQGTGTLGCSVRLGSGVRVPEGGRVCTLIDPDAVIGDACQNGSECGSGLGRCIFSTNLNSVPFFTNGYCTVDCDPAATENTCGADAVCQNLNRGSSLGGSCVKVCDSDADCRQAEGYRCLPSSSGANACLPMQ